MRVLVLGAGFGGLELTARLTEQLGSDVEVTLIDQAEGFAFGFSKLDVMFGHAEPDAVLHPLRRPHQARCSVRADHDPRHRPRSTSRDDRRR